MALTLHLGGSPGKGSHYLRPHNGYTMTRTIFYGFPESLGYYSALPGASWPVVFRVEDSWHMEAGPAHGNRIFILSYKKALLLYKDRIQLYVAGSNMEHVGDVLGNGLEFNKGEQTE